MSTETFVKALQKFKVEFCDDETSALWKPNIDKLIAPLDSKLMIAIKQVFGKHSVTCHYLYIKRLWQMASVLGLRQRRFVPNTKKLIDALKKLPFERQQFLEGKFEKIRKDSDGITFVNPRYIEFFNQYRK